MAKIVCNRDHLYVLKYKFLRNVVIVIKGRIKSVAFLEKNKFSNVFQPCFQAILCSRPLESPPPSPRIAAGGDDSLYIYRISVTASCLCHLPISLAQEMAFLNLHIKPHFLGTALRSVNFHEISCCSLI
jgi:hypothetical protein